MDPDEDLGGDPPCWAHLFDGPDAECATDRREHDQAERAPVGRRDEFDVDATSTPA